MDDYKLKPEKCSICACGEHEFKASYDSPHENENIFGLNDYYRELWLCSGCGLFSNQHRFDLSRIYCSDYGAHSYDYTKNKSRFNCIINLPDSKSDNRARVSRISEYFNSKCQSLPHELLDIGCGMAVFPYEMRKLGWCVTAIDPNPISVKHAVDLAGVQGVIGSFPNVELDKTFSLITFNKVLEHIQDAVECLAKSVIHLKEGGLIYVELPDGEMASRIGMSRQEFYFEHYYAFNFSSFVFLIQKAGLDVLRMERITEPSGKKTIFAFLQKK